MTKEEALKFIEAEIKCLEKNISGQCDSDDCDDCNLLYEQGTMGERLRALKELLIVLEESKEGKDE